MTPQKQKAVEIFDEYFSMKWQSYSRRKISIKQMTKAAAKECAKIAVNRIISAIDWHEFETPNKELEFWNDVLKEIDKL